MKNEAIETAVKTAKAQLQDYIYEQLDAAEDRGFSVTVDELKEKFKIDDLSKILEEIFDDGLFFSCSAVCYKIENGSVIICY